MQPEQLGPYKIVGKLGKGGMGTVYKVVNTETGEPAAVKLLSAALAQEEGFRDRFQSEIETLRKLNHPNIVRLFGFGEQAGLLFYGMELVDGNSLEEELGRGRRFDWREVVRIALEMCRALRHAHDRGVIHRDIKPGNLLLANQGPIKLSDFGIARLFGNTRLTRIGSIIGTAEYMAPEQAAGQPVEPRSDLYSLGAVLYVLLARRPVFKGKSLGELIHKQQYETPEPLSRYNTDIPEELERIILQLLEKDPGRRIPNAMILGRFLEAMRHAMAVPGETIKADTEYFSGESDAAGAVPLPSGEVLLPLDAVPPTGEPSTVDSTPPPGAVAKESLPDPFAATMPAEASSALTQKAAPEPQTSGRFVAVAEEDLDRKEVEPSRPAIISWQTGALVAALLALGLGIWHSLQPPSANALYGRIAAAVEDESLEALRLAEPDIRKFLYHYPHDPRAYKLRDYEREIALYRMERKFNLRVKGLAPTKQLMPVERAYLEAISFAHTNPERCITKLQAIIQLFEVSKKDVSGPTGRCVTLARRKLQQMHDQIERYSAEQLGLILTRLDEADRIAPDDAERARSMYQSVMELYSNKPWAAEAVRRAQAALSKMQRSEEEGEKSEE